VRIAGLPDALKGADEDHHNGNAKCQQEDESSTSDSEYRALHRLHCVPFLRTPIPDCQSLVPNRRKWMYKLLTPSRRADALNERAFSFM